MTRTLPPRHLSWSGDLDAWPTLDLDEALGIAQDAETPSDVEIEILQLVLESLQQL